MSPNSGIRRLPVVPDLELVKEARAGRLDSFEQLVSRHRPVVHRVAQRIVGPDEAEDVAQDTFLRAFHRLERFRGQGAFRSWLLQIAHNTALNALARRKPDPVGGDGELDQVSGASYERRGPASRLEERERRERLEQKLRLLSAEHRAVLVLRDLEGLSYEEIAGVTETPMGSVKGRLHRARGELIELLRHNTYDWELPK